MPVLVMLVMHVLMFVLERVVRVRMLVTFREMKPDPDRHEDATGK